MRKWLLGVVLAAGFVMIFAGVASADNGPHMGDFSSTTDACAGCHRVHRGQAKKLLTMSEELLCYSCHGATVTGAQTNVQSGVWEGTAGSDIGSGLRGGGFDFAVMDTGMTGTATSVAVSSKHDVGGTFTIWGNGIIGSGAGTTMGAALQCSTCHNPHGTSLGSRYRILRDTPDEGNATGSVNVADETTKTYSVSYDLDGWRKTDYIGGTTQNISAWCSTCHTRYMSTDAGNSGDAIFRYRHKTDNSGTGDGDRDCLSCHVAHGSSASMAGDGTTTYSANVEWPDATTVDSLANSRLLQVDNRGICVKCHPSP